VASVTSRAACHSRWKVFFFSSPVLWSQQFVSLIKVSVDYARIEGIWFYFQRKRKLSRIHGEMWEL